MIRSLALALALALTTACTPEECPGELVPATTADVRPFELLEGDAAACLTTDRGMARIVTERFTLWLYADESPEALIIPAGERYGDFVEVEALELSGPYEWPYDVEATVLPADLDVAIWLRLSLAS